MPRALTGLRIVTVSRGMAGALAGMILADHGADVVLLECPSGDPHLGPAGARSWHRGKTRISLDLDDEAQRTHAHALIREADVLLLGVRPTTAERWGLTHESLSHDHPELIVTSITGFGWDGPFRDQPISEALMHALSGGMMLAGNGALRPGPVFFAPHAAAYGAALLAVQGILAALRERDDSGLGQHVDTGLYQALLVNRGITLWNPEFHAEEFPALPATTDPRGVRPLFNLNQCSDGRWLSMGAWTPALSYRALEVMGRADLLSDERFAGIPNFFPNDAARRELLDILWAAFRERPMQEWLDAMDAQAVPCEPVLTVAAFRDIGQVWANRHAVRVEDPVLGAMVQPGVLGEFSGTPGEALPAEAAARPPSAADAIAARWREAPAVRGTGTVRAGGRGPLAGVRVLDLTMFLSGPMAGHLLSDLGADVLKAEPPEGDDFRMSAPSVFRFLHRDKRGVVVDLKTPEGQEQIERLVSRADVVLYNYRLGVEERLGVDYERLRKVNPGVIVCRITAFGAHGERAFRGGYDASIAALAGMHELQGGEGNPPVSITIADISTGLAAATAISVAIRARETSGIGQAIDITMIGAMAYVGGEAFVQFEGMPPPEKLDGGQQGTGPLERLYRTEDGWILLSARTTATERLRSALGLSATAELNTATLDTAISTRTTAAWLEAFGREGIACADPAVDARAFLHANPQLQASGTAIAVLDEHFGRLGQAGAAIRFSRTPVRIERQEPKLGEHNEAELGLLTAPAAY